MKVTIEVDEKEIAMNLIAAIAETDKDLIKQMFRGAVHEALYSLNPATIKLIGRRIREIEHEMHYQMEQDVRH